jgi:hypothetical protein
MIGHIMGLPIEESVLQFAPAGAVTVGAFVIGGRVMFRRIANRLKRL